MPEQLAVMGFGDQDFAAEVVPPLTTLRVDRDALGIRAAEALLSRMNGIAEGSSTIRVGFEITERATVGRLT